jgi:hypothetical protein
LKNHHQVVDFQYEKPAETRILLGEGGGRIENGFAKPPEFYSGHLISVMTRNVS